MSRRTKTTRQTVFLPAKPAEAYEAYLKGKKHSAFTGQKATCNARVGGKFTACDGYIWGKNLELVTGRRIVQQWQTSEWPPDAPPSVLQLTFEEHKGHTKLTMVHSEVPAEQAEAYRQGWIDYYWDPLKKYLQNS